MADTLHVDEEFQGLCPPLLPEELELLRSSLQSDGCRESIKVWEQGGKRLIVDGHNRYAICREGSIAFNVEAMEFDDRAAAVDWIINQQLGRRNLTPEQKTYLIGKRYTSERLARGRPPSEESPEESAEEPGESEAVNGSTADRLAEEYGTSPRTITRAAAYSEALDLVGERIGADVKDLLMRGAVHATQAAVVQYAAMPLGQARRVATLLRNSTCDRLRAAMDRIIGNGAEVAEPAAQAVVDACGNEVPDRLRSLVTEDKLSAAAKTLGGVMREIRGCVSADAKFGAWLVLEEFVDAIGRARSVLLNGRFHAVCPRCNGRTRGCRECRNVGYVPQWRLEELQQEAASRE